MDPTVGGGRAIYTWALPRVPCPAIILVSQDTALGHTMLFVNSRYILLTYAQSNGLDEWAVSDMLSQLGAECIVARENHKDGGTHLHVFADFNRKFRSRDVHIFDVGGFHPNVSPSRGTPEKGFDYAIKDGDVVAGGLARPPPRGGLHAGAHRVRNVAHLCEDSEEFLELCDEMERGELINRFSNYSAYAHWRFKPDVPEYSTPEGFEFVGGELDGRDDWVRDSGIRGGEPLIGTCLARRRGGVPPTAPPRRARARGDTPPPLLECAVPEWYSLF